MKLGKVSKSSANDGKHPYMQTRKWVDGTLAFWRGRKSVSYTKEAIEYYEARLKDWKERENNMANLNNDPL
jgi:hypothetical protein